MPELTSAGAAEAPEVSRALARLMAAHGVKMGAGEFRAAVRRVLDAGGVAAHDAVNQDLARTLPAQLQKLTADFLSRFPPPGHRMTALDLACRDGLGAELLLATRLGAFIRHIDLLDPAQEMLQLCAARESLLSFRHRLISGRIEDLPARGRYDVMLAVGVLRQMGDLKEFLRQVSLRQSSGGIFLHLDDPDAESPEAAEIGRRPRRGFLRQVAGRVRGSRDAARHIREINAALRKENVIRRSLTAEEMGLAAGLPRYQGRPVSIREMAQILAEYRLVAACSYASSGAPASGAAGEIEAPGGACPGGLMGGIWRKIA